MGIVTIALGIVLAFFILIFLDVVIVIGLYLLVAVIAAAILNWLGAPFEVALMLGLLIPGGAWVVINDMSS